MANDWNEYQEEAAAFFRSLGLEASTNVRKSGVRTTHDIDVLVTLDVAGAEVTWIIECKHWKNPVSKLHVLALREIVNDLGVDRGIILCEVGFQSGALEAATLTNVRVSSLAELTQTSRDALGSFRLRELLGRVSSCRERYWELPKEVRIEKGLRPDFHTIDLYTGIFVVEVAEKYIGLAFRSAYPILVDPFDIAKTSRILPDSLCSPADVVEAFEPLIDELEGLLSLAEG